MLADLRRRPMLALWLIAAAVNVVIGVVLALRPDRAGPFLLLTSWTREWLVGGMDVYSRALADVDYPPHSIVALSPLALLPAPLTVPLWTIFNVCLALVAPYLAARLVVRRPRIDQVVYLTALFLSWGGSKVFLQFSLLMLVLGLAATVVSETRPALSGILLGLSLMKPQIAAPFFLWTLFTRRWKVAGVSLAVVAAGTGLFCLRVGTNPVDVALRYVGILKLYYTGSRAMAGTSQMHPLLATLFPGKVGDLLAALVAVALLALICIEGWKRLPTDEGLLYAAPALAAIWSLLTFYHLTYGFVLLLPVAALLLLVPDSEWRRERKATLWVMQFALMFDVPGIWRRAVSFLPDARVMDAIFSNADRVLMAALFVTLFAISRDRQTIVRSRPLFRIAAAWALPLVFSLIAIVLLNRAFQLGTPVVLLHISIVMSVVSLAIAGLAWLARSGVPMTNRTSRAVMSSLAATVGALMVALYAGDAIGNRFWDGNLDYRILWEYGKMMAPNRPPFFIPVAVHASALGAVAILFIVSWYWCRTVVRAIYDYGGATRSSPSRRLVGVAATATALMIASVGLTASWAARRNILHREPIVGFFASVNTFADFNQHVLDLDLPRLERLARQQYPKGQTFDRRNVVIVIIDSLRADHMGVYGYERPTTPFLTTLFESGRLKKVALALSTCAESTCGILSTLDSKTLRKIAPRSFSLPALLQDQGYDVYQILSGDHVWKGLRAAYGTDQTFYFDGSSSKHYAVTDDRLLFEGLEAVPDFSGKPAFFHFHLMSAHDAGIRLASYRRYQPSTVRIDFDSLFGGTNDPASLVNNYDNGVLQADAMVAQLFEKLRTKGYLANSLVVILADHGEGFGEHGSYGHVFSLHQEFIHIPLLIYDEGEYGNLTFATQTDVAPTIVDRLGLIVPPNWEGRSLLQSEIKQFSIHQTRKWSPCYALTYRVPPALYKYLRCAPESSPEELYELGTDPGERRNLAASAPSDVLQTMRGRLREVLASTTVK